MSSHAESISAWYAVLLCPSIVAAFRVYRQGPLSSSAALRNTAARSSNGSARQAGPAGVRLDDVQGLALAQDLPARHGVRQLDGPLAGELGQPALERRAFAGARG